MLEKWYCCDCGSVCVDCGGSLIRFDNSLGDGDYKAYLMNQTEFDEFVRAYDIEPNAYNFISCCTFKNAKVLDYDCPNEWTDVIFKLDGEYCIYSYRGNVFFVFIREREKRTKKLDK